MICREENQGRRIKSDIWGGIGDVHFQDLFTENDLGGRMTMLSRVTLMPGDVIGPHSHTENGEVYYVLEGSGIVTDDGEEYRLAPGDAQFCADGHVHGLRNDTDAPLVFLAVIVPNR